MHEVPLVSRYLSSLHLFTALGSASGHTNLTVNWTRRRERRNELSYMFDWKIHSRGKCTSALGTLFVLTLAEMGNDLKEETEGIQEKGSEKIWDRGRRNWEEATVDRLTDRDRADNNLHNDAVGVVRGHDKHQLTIVSGHDFKLISDVIQVSVKG